MFQTLTLSKKAAALRPEPRNLLFGVSLSLRGAMLMTLATWQPPRRGGVWEAFWASNSYIPTFGVFGMSFFFGGKNPRETLHPQKSDVYLSEPPSQVKILQVFEIFTRKVWA